MKTLCWIGVASLLIVARPAGAQVQLKSYPAGVVIIRHGEKPPHGDNLSCQGLFRALSLPAVLPKFFQNAKVPGAPDMTYVPTMNVGAKTSSVRMFQTVTPFAVAMNLAINSQHGESKVKAAAQDVLGAADKWVLMVWEHSNIPGLVAELKVKDSAYTTKGSWPDTDFDSILTITYPGGKATITKSAEGIAPPKCTTLNYPAAR